PAVLPLNTQFAFVTNRTGSQQIWLQNKEGYPPQPLVTEEDFDGAGSMAIGSLAVSPDGTKLAFQRASSVAGPDLPAGSRLWIKSLPGGKPFRVPATPIRTRRRGRPRETGLRFSPVSGRDCTW